jgi:hypothetical protein
MHSYKETIDVIKSIVTNSPNNVNPSVYSEERNHNICLYEYNGSRCIVGQYLYEIGEQDLLDLAKYKWSVDGICLSAIDFPPSDRFDMKSKRFLAKLQELADGDPDPIVWGDATITAYIDKMG